MLRTMGGVYYFFPTVIVIVFSNVVRLKLHEKKRFFLKSILFFQMAFKHFEAGRGLVILQKRLTKLTRNILTLRRKFPKELSSNAQIVCSIQGLRDEIQEFDEDYETKALEGELENDPDELKKMLRRIKKWEDSFAELSSGLVEILAHASFGLSTPPVFLSPPPPAPLIHSAASKSTSSSGSVSPLQQSSTPDVSTTNK